jgi:hypothetical protein
VHFLNSRPTHPPTDFFSLVFFSTFLGVTQRWEFKTPQKTFVKQIMSKSFYKKSTKNPKPIFFSRFCFIVFGRFSARGFKNTPKNIKKYVTLLLFWPLTHPPTTGSSVLFVSVSAAPCACACAAAAAAADLGHVCGMWHVAFFALTIEQPRPAWAVAHVL